MVDIKGSFGTDPPQCTACHQFLSIICHKHPNTPMPRYPMACTYTSHIEKEQNKTQMRKCLSFIHWVPSHILVADDPSVAVVAVFSA